MPLRPTDRIFRDGRRREREGDNQRRPTTSRPLILLQGSVLIRPSFSSYIHSHISPPAHVANATFPGPLRREMGERRCSRPTAPKGIHTHEHMYVRTHKHFLPLGLAICVGRDVRFPLSFVEALSTEEEGLIRSSINHRSPFSRLSPQPQPYQMVIRREKKKKKARGCCCRDSRAIDRRRRRRGPLRKDKHESCAERRRRRRRPPFLYGPHTQQTVRKS